MNIIDLFRLQGYEGIIISGVIFAVLVMFFIMAVCVLIYYSAINKQAERLKAGQDINTNSAYIKAVQTAYADASEKGVRDVGDTEILDKNINPAVRLFEYIIHYLPAFATILGLSGTFLGLTLAISQMQFDLGMDGIQEVTHVIDRITEPMAAMATAFVTSLVGIIASAFMNIFERLTRLFVRNDEALAVVRDYINMDYQRALLAAMTPAQKHAVFENDPTAMAWGEGARRISKVLSGLKEAVEKMSDDVASLENRGIIALTNSITSLIRAYQHEHDDIASVNESMGKYLSMLTDMGRVLEQHTRVTASNETLFEQMAATYRMLAEEHRLYEAALTAQTDTDLARTIRDQLQTLISRVEGSAVAR